MKIHKQIAVVFSVWASAAGAQVPTVLTTVAQEGSAPKYIDSDGTAKGHCPDILRAIEKVDKGLRFEIDPTPTPIKRIEFKVKDGKLDVVCALLDTPLRNEISIRISTPIFYVRERLVGRSDEALQVHSFKDLADTGDLVSTQAGASYAAMLRDQGIKVDEAAGGTPIALRAVLNKRTRFYYTNELTGAYYIKAEGLNDKLRLMPGTLQESPSYLWTSRQLGPDVVQRLEKAVAKLQQDGVLDKIYKSYLGGR